MPERTDKKRAKSSEFFLSISSLYDSVREDRGETLLALGGEHIDLEKGADKTGGNVKAAKKMLCLLVDGFYKDLPLLIAAKEKDDWKAIESLIHKHHGGSYFCGAPRFSEICARLEAYLTENKTKWRDALYEKVLDEMQHIVDLKDLYRTSEQKNPA